MGGGRGRGDLGADGHKKEVGMGNSRISAPCPTCGSVLKDDEEERDLSWTFVAELFRRVKERRRRHRLFRKGTIEEHVGG